MSGILLDTHAWLWFISEPARLPTGVAVALCDGKNPVHLSVASLWEVAIKHARGRLPLPLSLGDFFARYTDAAGLQLVGIRPEHVIATAALPHLHGDPFDRMLVARAQVERLTIVTADSKIGAYGVPVHWDEKAAGPTR